VTLGDGWPSQLFRLPQTPPPIVLLRLYSFHRSYMPQFCLRNLPVLGQHDLCRSCESVRERVQPKLDLKAVQRRAIPFVRLAAPAMAFGGLGRFGR
jgi:hypothetical protein